MHIIHYLVLIKKLYGHINIYKSAIITATTKLLDG
jgi:hypothetical protein